MTLGAVRAATIVCPDVDQAVDVYVRHLSYRPVQRSAVTAALASVWGAPAVAGCRLAVLAPASGAGTFLRFVEMPGSAPYAPCSAWGWHALELTVADCDAATAQVARGPFQVLGEPRELSFSDGALKASQLQGPFGEVLYLTEVRRPVPGYELPIAKTLIDRIFIVVLHARSAAAGLGWYASRFGNAATPTMGVAIEFMARLHGLDPSVPYQIGTLALEAGFYFEVDDTPEHVLARPRPPGGLPPGIAMVTCLVHGPDAAAALLPAEANCGPVYTGARTIRRGEGPAGEWLEFLGADARAG